VKPRNDRLAEHLDRLKHAVASSMHATKKTGEFEISSLYHLIQLLGFLSERSKKEAPPPMLVAIVMDFSMDVFREFSPRLSPVLKRNPELSSRVAKCLRFDKPMTAKKARTFVDVELDSVMRLTRLIRMEAEELARETSTPQPKAKSRPKRKS
jgi:hypothetical protein